MTFRYLQKICLYNIILLDICIDTLFPKLCVPPTIGIQPCVRSSFQRGIQDHQLAQKLPERLVSHRHGWAGKQGAKEINFDSKGSTINTRESQFTFPKVAQISRERKRDIDSIELYIYIYYRNSYPCLKLHKHGCRAAGVRTTLPPHRPGPMSKSPQSTHQRLAWG